MGREGADHPDVWRPAGEHPVEVIIEGVERREPLGGSEVALVADVVDGPDDVVDAAQHRAPVGGEHPQRDGEVLRPLRDT